MLFTDAELRWLEKILYRRFGHEFVLEERVSGLVMAANPEGQSIVFDSLQPIFHQSQSDFSCYEWRSSLEGFEGPIDDLIPAPSQVELPIKIVDFHDLGATLHYDIIGLVYWMLSRLEEVGRADLDEHQRFPATSSHAYKYGYLERPIVDEWLAILGQVIDRVWPQLNLKKHDFRIRVSHDVDRPSQYGFKSWKMLSRILVGDFLKNGDIKPFLQAPYFKLVSRRTLSSADPFNTFDWLMSVSEENNLKSAFYFICGRTEPARDGDYEVEHPAIRDLIRKISQRGHEIGLHPSYGTYQHPDLIKQEFHRLKRVCADEGIAQNEWGGRMHYLRWEQPETLRAWASAGMDYDSTLGYADRPGFRCGTCHEYPAFDPVAQEVLPLRIRPLIAMECSVMSPLYLGLVEQDQALDKLSKLKSRCAAVKGEFTLLWHNSFFEEAHFADVYRSIISR